MLQVFAFKCDHTDAGCVGLQVILRSNVSQIFPKSPSRTSAVAKLLHFSSWIWRSLSSCPWLSLCYLNQFKVKLEKIIIRNWFIVNKACHTVDKEITSSIRPISTGLIALEFGASKSTQNSSAKCSLREDLYLP